MENTYIKTGNQNIKKIEEKLMKLSLIKKNNEELDKV